MKNFICIIVLAGAPFFFCAPKCKPVQCFLKGCPPICQTK